MSRDFPDLIDPWRLAESRRSFKGTWPLAAFDRLAPLLAANDGEVSFSMDFGIDDIGLSYIDIELKAELTLTCQRTLELYQHPVARTVRLGLLRDEADEAALPEAYEPLLAAEAPLAPTTLLEDELILAVPLVPKKPDAPLECDFGPPVPETEDNPFAILRALKTDQSN